MFALGVSAASTSPSVTVPPSPDPLAALVTDWLAATAPTSLPPPNPQPTYQLEDFAIWTQQLASKDSQGYLDLVLAALTQGFVIPPFTATPNAGTSSGSTLTFGSTAGIGVGMSVGGTNIDSGTTVQSVSSTTVGLSKNVTGPVSSITFNQPIPPITETTTSAGSVLSFPATTGINVGMPVSGTNIASGSTVQSVTTTTVTISTQVLGDVPSGTVITFNQSTTPFTETTNQDTQPGLTLTFASTSGIANNMLVSGPNIANGTTVQSFTATTVTINPPASGDVPVGTVITFNQPVPPNTIPSTLADQIALWLATLPPTTSPAPPNPTVATLKAVTASQWTTFFTANPTWLPDFTAADRACRSADNVPRRKCPTKCPRLRHHAHSGVYSSGPAVLYSVIRRLEPSIEGAWFSADFPPSATTAIGFYRAGSYVPSRPALSPGKRAIDERTDRAAVQAFVTAVVDLDPAAQAWLEQAIASTNELCLVASVVPNPINPTSTVWPIPPSLPFSVVEALYARGFRSAKDITDLSAADFQQAMTGTVAYDYANSASNSLYVQAQKVQSLTPATPASPSGESFQPINPDGKLINCVPPPCLSPTGPIAYLQEMLQLSEGSTCDHPFPTAHTTLSDAVAARRGSLGALLASCANLETPLPLIDLVNECLEYVGSVVAPTGNATAPPSGGKVYDTSADKLAGLALCNEEDCPKEDKEASCHDPAKIFAALPEYSTPATPTATNGQVEPLVFNDLKTDFSACCLPYSQALDVSRTYLRHFRTSRFEAMRTFRKCITEFVLQPASPPAEFQSQLWRWPVRIETAIEYLGITPEEYAMLFQGTSALPCGRRLDDSIAASTTSVPPWQLYGYPTSGGDFPWTNNVVILSNFLERTCLSYCEFLELSQSGFMTITGVVSGSRNNDADRGNLPSFPDCEPCCLANYTLQFPTAQAPTIALEQLAVFIRLWRKLKEHCGGGYSFAHLADICQVLGLYPSTGTINPEFIRQLVAFQMLRDHFRLPLVDPGDHTPGTTGADRTHLLALWVGTQRHEVELGPGPFLGSSCLRRGAELRLQAPAP